MNVAAAVDEGRGGSAARSACPGGAGDLAAAALRHAARGWPVLPVHGIVNGRCTCSHDRCTTAGKHPRIKKWQHAASTDPAIIRGWWKKWPTANIGILTGRESGLVVIDVDPRNDGRLEQDGDRWRVFSADRFVAELPATRVHRTGGGGWHAFFGYHPDVWSCDLAPGVEIKSDGRYVITPPSKHSLGGKYEILVDAPLAEMPAPVVLLASVRKLRESEEEPETVTPESASATTSGYVRLEVDAWLQEHGCAAQRGPWNDGGTKWVLAQCPFKPGHTDHSAYVVQLRNGAVAAGCHHHSCDGKGWRDLRALYGDAPRTRRMRAARPEPDRRATPKAMAHWLRQRGYGPREILRELRRAFGPGDRSA